MNGQAQTYFEKVSAEIGKASGQIPNYSQVFEYCLISLDLFEHMHQEEVLKHLAREFPTQSFPPSRR